MYELHKVGTSTYYISSPTNIGIYVVGDEAYLIDSGNDKDAAKKLLRILEENGWQLSGIYNTHSNADHIGGNAYLAGKVNDLSIFCSEIENAFIRFPQLEPSFLYGAFPPKELRNKFLMAKPSHATDVADHRLSGLEVLDLSGHFFSMIGYRTDDDVYFIADSVFSEETIEKYAIFFLYDVRAFLSTLDYLDTLDGKLCIPSHAAPTSHISRLAECNRAKVKEILRTIVKLTETPCTFEALLKQIFERYHLDMNWNQYGLVGSTIRSYLSYLSEEGKITSFFEDYKLYFIACKEFE